jgi:hypothetical protein
MMYGYGDTTTKVQNNNEQDMIEKIELLAISRSFHLGHGSTSVIIKFS